MSFQMPNVEQDYVRFYGGIDQASPVFSIKPGALLDCSNYEPGVYGGYTRIDGYERFDGRTRPSTASYWLTPCSLTGAVAVGDTVTGATSGATGKVLQVNSTTELVLGRVSGTFNAAENLTVGGVVKGATAGSTVINSATTNVLSATYRHLAADDYRTDILAVPGSGAILGVAMFNDVLYAFRNNVGGTAAVMYKSTSSGWTAVTMLYEVTFSAGATATPADGATLTQGGVTATVRRVVTRTGAWGGTAAGTFVISAPAGGNFAAGAATLTGGATCTLAGIQTAIALNPGGRYEFIVANFFGQQDQTRLYGCDGKNPAFEFDGTYYVPIHTGMTTDTPAHIIDHKKHLFLSFNSSVQNSSIGDPHAWTPITGAAEIATGELVTGFSPLQGEVLGILNRNRTYQLLGSSSADWQLQTLTPKIGALPYTAVNVGMTHVLDDRGLIRLEQAAGYGNFESSSESRIIQKAIDIIRPNVIGAIPYRSRNQYRLYANDGTGVIMGVEGDKVTGFTKFQYEVNPSCLWSEEDSTGQERIFFGADNGYVYEANVGTSFDDKAINAFIYPPHNTSKSPRFRKKYRRVVLEMVSQEYSAINFFPEFSFGDADIATHPVMTVGDIGGAGGWFDISNWDQAFFDGGAASNPTFSLAGAGNSMSMIFYSSSSIDMGHTLNGMFVHFTPTRLSR